MDNIAQILQAATPRSIGAIFCRRAGPEDPPYFLPMPLPRQRPFRVFVDVGGAGASRNDDPGVARVAVTLH